MDTFKAAGVVFTNGKHILAGHQPYKKQPCISGIGGSRESCESYIQTALRECIEELFEPPSIPKTLIQKLIHVLIPRKVIKSDDYINIVYTFDDLHVMLKIIKRSRLYSPLYEIFPKTLHELIMNRIITPGSEISHLALLPLTKICIDPLFNDDVTKLVLKMV